MTGTAARRTGGLTLLVLSSGAVGHTQRWVDYFVDRGDEVHLASVEAGVPTRAIEHRLPSLAPVGVLRYPLTVPFVKRLVARIDPDVVVGHFVPNYGFVGALTGRHPLVCVGWGSDVLLNAGRTPFHRWRARMALERADLVLSDAEMLTRAIEAQGIEPRRIETFTFGIDTRRFRPLEGPKPEPKVVLSYRQLLPLYHVDLLIRAVPRVREAHADPIEVRIIGQGPEREALRRLSHELGVDDVVTFVEGRLTDEALIDEIRQAAVYVSCSRSDTTSVSLLEAMACGTAPAVTNIPGNREWLDDGVNGLLVPTDDPEPLARAIVRLLDDDTLRERFVEHNLRLVRARGDWATNMERTRRLLTELAASPAGRGVGVAR
jgi:glycosyltransferase involved in cell wall biosynthesis